MREIGLKTPITVRPAGEKTALVSGLHRLEAAKLLGWEWIDVVCMHADDRQTRLWQISENLHRADLTVLQRDAQIVEWLKLIDDAPGVSGQVVRKPQGGRPESGISLAARRLPVMGRSKEARRKSVERAISVDNISPRAKAAAVATGLDDNQSALLAVAKQPTPEAQLKKVTELASREPQSRTARAAFGDHGRNASNSETEVPSGSAWSTEEETSFTWLKTAWRRASEVMVAWAKAPLRVRNRFISEVLRGHDADDPQSSDAVKATHGSPHDDHEPPSGKSEPSANPV